jgi:hypothetical protein
LLGGSDPDAIVRHVKLVTSEWTASRPVEYRPPLVAKTVVCIVLGFRRGDAAEEEWLRQWRS